jgi:hypothetical protein
MAAVDLGRESHQRAKPLEADVEEEDVAPANGHDPTAYPAGFRLKPHNVEAEQALLGAILINNAAYREVSSYLRPAHFYEPIHGRIYAAMAALIDAGRLADPLTLKLQFDQDEGLRELDGAQYLARLARVAETIANAGEYGRMLHDLGVRRGLIEIGEALVNRAYDPRLEESGPQMLEEHRGMVETLREETGIGIDTTCRLPAIDFDMVFSHEVPAPRLLIDRLCLVGCAGLLSGPGSGGKSFLELIKVVCIATGTKFLGEFECDQTAALVYLSEDEAHEVMLRLRNICQALKITPAMLFRPGGLQLEIVPTKGAQRSLFQVDPKTREAVATPWFYSAVDRAKKLKARYLSFDHVGRYWSIEHHVNNSQVFQAFTIADGGAMDLDGVITFLHHPSKEGSREAAQKPDKPMAVQSLVGGAGAMTNAPRFVQTLRWFSRDDQRFRLFQSHKTNSEATPSLARRLIETDGVVTDGEEIDLDEIATSSGRKGGKGGRPSEHADTFKALCELFATHRREITMDELLAEAVLAGSVSDYEPTDRNAYHQRCRTIRRHLGRYRAEVAEREKGRFVLKPGALG